MNKSFQKYLKIRWAILSIKDKQFAIMNSLNCASSILQGTNVSSAEAIKFAEEILEHFYQFEFLQKPDIKSSITGNAIAEKFNKEAEEIKKEPF